MVDLLSLHYRNCVTMKYLYVWWGLMIKIWELIILKWTGGDNKRV